MLFLLLATVASAEQSVMLTQARQSYTRGDYLAASRLLERGLASGIDDPTQRQQVRLYLAASYFAMGDREASRRALDLLFGETPQYQIPAELFPPPFLAAVEEARPRPRPPPTQATAAPVVEPIVAPPLAPPSPGVRRFAWIPAVLGVACGGASAGLYVHARGQHLALVDQPVMNRLTDDEAMGIASSGGSTQLAAGILIGVASAALLVALALALFGGPTP